jgi:transcriptional regulator with XRE-family HTH domain
MRFADNFARLLGLHRLTAKRAAALLEVTPVSVSRWLNGHREPDGDSLWRISMYFLVDPWVLTESEAKDILHDFARPSRFEAVERQLSDGITFSQLNRETQMELRRHEARRRQEEQEVENDPVKLLARALAAVALQQQPLAVESTRSEPPVQDVIEAALKEVAEWRRERPVPSEASTEAAHRRRVARAQQPRKASGESKHTRA